MNKAKERETITKDHSAITFTLPEKNTVSGIKEPYYRSKATHFWHVLFDCYVHTTYCKLFMWWFSFLTEFDRKTVWWFCCCV